jgi:hypothetical protein
MKYLLLTKYVALPGVPPMAEWPAGDADAHIAFLSQLNDELTERGELVDMQALLGPDSAKIVTSDGAAPVVSDGPFAESKEFLAGYQLVEVASEDRALEIAAQVSAAPGPGGVPIGQPIEVRPVMGS